MSKFKSWLKKVFKIHEHDRKTFCVGQIAFVKCITCGDESIPWEVTKKVADAWHESHPKAMEELLEIKNKLEARV